MSAGDDALRAAAGVLADALSYPDAALAARLREGAARAPAPVGDPLRAVAALLDALGPGAAEELYTATFDLGAAATPCAGELLCGGGPRRAALLAHLAERRRAAGLAPGLEPADHVAELVRLAGAEPAADAEELVALALAPAARALRAALPRDNPYRLALDALLATLPAAAPAATTPQEASP